MKKLLYIFALFVSVLSFSSCSEEDFTTFNGEKSGIYIQKVCVTDIYGNPTEYTDSAQFSFASYSGDQEYVTQNIDINIMGNVSNNDRAFVLKVDEEKSTGIRGVHFDFDDDACIIQAGKASVRIPVKVYRHEDLSKGNIRIELVLESNENFTVELDKYKNHPQWNSTSDELSGRRFKIIASEKYSSTMWWDWFGIDYFGDWSMSKEKRVNAILHCSHLDWVNFNVKTGLMGYGAKVLKNQLQDAADEGNPIIDDDGSYMQLPSPYTVDYSAFNN